MNRRRSILFLSGFMVAAIAVLLIGWFTGVRVVMHTVLLSLFVTAFLPFVLVAAVVGIAIGLALVIIFVSLLTGSPDDPQTIDVGLGGVQVAVEAGLKGGPLYYRLLSRIRHSAIWGIIMGVLAGGLSLWGVLSWLIVPRELATSQILANTAATLMDTYKETGKFPTPADGGFFNARDVGHPSDGPLQDAFGQPLRYTTSGRSIFASFTLRSVGFDGKDGADDLCVSGAAKGAEWAGKLDHLLSHVRIGKDGKPPKLKDRLQTIRALRCEDQ